MASIRKRGNGWQAQVRLCGQPTISKSFKYKSDALLWSRGQEARIERGEPLDRNDDFKSMQLRHLLGKYAREVTPNKRSAEKENYRIHRILRHWIADVRLRDLKAHHFAQFRNERLQQAGSQAVRHDLNLLGHVLKTASLDWGVPVSNPVQAIRKPAVSKPRNRRLKPREEELLLQGCNRSTVNYLKPIIVLALETAMRRGEILNIKWDHINASERTLKIPITKNEHPRTIPLSETALTTLLDTPNGHSEQLYPIAPGAFRLAWDRLRKRVGIEDLHFHDLRHEAISRFFEKGLSIPEVALISGHRDPRMLFRYTHLRAEDVAKRLNDLESCQR